MATRALLLLCLVLGALTFALSRGPTPSAPSPAEREGPSQRAHLSEAIAQTLAGLELTPGDLGTRAPLILRLPQGPVPVEHLALYLPPGLGTAAVVAALRGVSLPGLTWLERAGADLTLSLEARLEGIPTHLIELTPPFHPKGPKPGAAPTPVALVISGLGPEFQRFAPLLDTPQTVSLALLPFTPFALEWGEEGHAAGKEIWVDLSEAAALRKRGVRASLEAIPNGEGIYLPTAAPFGEPAPQGLFSLLNQSRWMALLGGPGLLAEAQAGGATGAVPWRLSLPGRGWAERELARLLMLAERDGVAIGVIDARTISPESILFWMKGVERLGFEPIGAREALSLLRHAKRGGP